MKKKHEKDNTPSKQKIRLDKWLWAARLYKTRAIAKQMINGGKVTVNQLKAKTSKEVSVGDYITLKQGDFEKKIQVLAIDDQRKTFSIAQLLYEETQESIKKREDESSLRKANNLMHFSKERPNKKQRRELQELKRTTD